MRPEMEALKAQVAEQITVETSAATLIDGLQDQLTTAINDADWVAVTKMRDDLVASKDALTTAMLENTPTPPTQ